MAAARSKQTWDQTAELWVILANAHRDTKAAPQPYTRDMVHPLRTADDYRPEQPQVGDLSGLKAMLVGGK